MSFFNLFHSMITTIANIQPIILIVTTMTIVVSKGINHRLIYSKSSFNDTNFSIDSIKEDILEMLNPVLSDNIKFEFGSFYRFDGIKNIIVLKKKENYSLFEGYICFHEAGHCYDSNNKWVNKMYRLAEFISVTGILILLFILVYLIIFVLTQGQPTLLGNVSFSLLIFLMITRIMRVIIIEVRANIIAKRYLDSKEIVKPWSKQSFAINLFWINALLDQTALQVMLFSTVSSFYYMYSVIVW